MNRFAEIREPVEDDGHKTQFWSKALNLLKSVVFETEPEGTIAWQNDDLAARFLHSVPENVPHSVSDFELYLNDTARRARQKALKSLTWDGAQYALTYCMSGYGSPMFWVEERGQRLSGTPGKPGHVLCTLTKVDARKQVEERAAYTASFDALSGLWNRVRLREGINYLLAIALRYDRPAGFMRVKVTNLVDVNTTYGFEAGDRLLKGVADRLKHIVRQPDIVGRLGGAHFGIGLSECPHEVLKPLAERIMKDLSATPYSGMHGDIVAEFSISGVLLSKTKDYSAKSADQALRQTKMALESQQNLHGEFVEYSPKLLSTRPSAPNVETREEDIVSALNERRISLAYQPIIDAKTRELHHYECLLRLRHNDGEIVSAGQFILEAERLGLIHLLDRRALELASERLKQDKTLKIALNVSAGTVKNIDAADKYLEAVKALGPFVENITLELTETVALEDPALATRFANEAHAIGLEFSIDDFGSGYTSFQNLMAIEADSIKIDGSFIQELSTTPHKQTFVRMMVDLAQTLSIKTVAEMVDNPDDAELLVRLGVDYLQGYLFGVPSPTPNYKSPNRHKP